MVLFLLFALLALVIVLKGNLYLSTTEIVPTEIPVQPTEYPWLKSVCGNGICEKCESDNDCCNYAPVKTKSGYAYPPPTCLGLCPNDCPAK